MMEQDATLMKTPGEAQAVKGSGPRPADRLKGIDEYYFSQKLREIDGMNRAGKQVINLGIGSPDLPPHPEVIKTLYEESLKPSQHGYQNYKGNPVLRKSIAE